jgi:hypothetical protein
LSADRAFGDKEGIASSNKACLWGGNNNPRVSEIWQSAVSPSFRQLWK